MKFLRCSTFLFLLGTTVLAQTFSSGSTGVDGVLDLTFGDRTVQLPASGVLNYTTVNIPAGRTLSFTNNTGNTAVVMLAQGVVNIGGTINVSASGITPGPGGFFGGAPGQLGFGPGPGQPAFAGQPISNHDATWAGPLSLVPNIGGSGGGGTSGCGSNTYGGSGGGAITIASSSSIVLSGNVLANPSLGQGVGGNQCGATGSYGAPGAIRLVANSINVSGNLSAAIARLEAPLNALAYSGYGATPVLSTINPLILPTNPPALSIVSIGGYPVPSYSGSSLTTIDLLLPNQLQDPIAVVIQATNVPVGSLVGIAFGGSGGATSTTATLSGTMASSNATVYVSGLNRSGGSVTFVFASTTFSASLIADNLIPGVPNGLSRIELAAAPGAKTTYRFLRSDGSEIDAAKLPPDIRHLFGL
jgi:hypothetical protein